MLRILALVPIIVGATIAWEILYGTLLIRTEQSDSAQRATLGSLWGPEQSQCAPVFTTVAKRPQVLPIEASRVDVDLDLVQRKKGLLWYNTYRVKFGGEYRVVNTTRADYVRFLLRFPADGGVYDGVEVSVGGIPMPSSTVSGTIATTMPLPPGHSADVKVSYASQGIARWSYRFGPGINAIHDFDLVMRTNFDAIDFPPETLAPTDERRTPDGWLLTWRYGNLVAASGVGMILPQPLQPGPLAQRITFWAPLSLLFYFFVMVIITTMRRIDLHPMNYFFLAAAFFSFHLLFAYTVDRLPIVTAFVVCSSVSMFLTVSYLRLVAGWRFAAVEAGLAQFFYLIVFSLALFNEGNSGLTITIGSILTLFVAMQLTGRIRWGERLTSPSTPL
jgi:hypothetical protein